MSLSSEADRAPRKQRRKRKPSAPKWLTLGTPLVPSHPDQILSFLEWCALNRFSERTGRRVIASGNGPIVTRTSVQRIGITVGNNARWQASRERRGSRQPRQVPKARG